MLSPNPLGLRGGVGMEIQSLFSCIYFLLRVNLGHSFAAVPVYTFMKCTKNTLTISVSKKLYLWVLSTIQNIIKIQQSM